MNRASAWPWAAAGRVAGVVVGPAAPAWAQDSKVLAGYWEGKGAIWDRPLDDAVRKLTRRSETTFWLACDKQLRCRGEATTTYAGDLVVPTAAFEFVPSRTYQSYWSKRSAALRESCRALPLFPWIGRTDEASFHVHRAEVAVEDGRPRVKART